MAFARCGAPSRDARGSWGTTHRTQTSFTRRASPQPPQTFGSSVPYGLSKDRQPTFRRPYVQAETSGRGGMASGYRDVTARGIVWMNVATVSSTRSILPRLDLVPIPEDPPAVDLEAPARIEREQPLHHAGVDERRRERAIVTSDRERPVEDLGLEGDVGHGEVGDPREPGLGPDQERRPASRDRDLHARQESPFVLRHGVRVIERAHLEVMPRARDHVLDLAVERSRRPEQLELLIRSPNRSSAVYRIRSLRASSSIARRRGWSRHWTRARNRPMTIAAAISSRACFHSRPAMRMSTPNARKPSRALKAVVRLTTVYRHVGGRTEPERRSPDPSAAGLPGGLPSPSYVFLVAFF